MPWTTDDEPDDESAAAPDESAAAPSSTVLATLPGHVLRVGSIEITPDGVPVEAADLDQVRAAAHACRVTLRES